MALLGEIKAKEESLVKSAFRNLFIKLTAEETKVKRIRLYTQKMIII